MGISFITKSIELLSVSLQYPPLHFLSRLSPSLGLSVKYKPSYHSASAVQPTVSTICPCGSYNRTSSPLLFIIGNCEDVMSASGQEGSSL